MPVTYTHVKQTVLGIRRSAVAELGPYSIRVNCVSSNMLPTPLAAAALGMEGRELEQTMEEKVVLKDVRHTRDDAAHATLYLATDKSKYIGGLSLLVDGAFTVTNPSLGFF
jgi:NAD(P)-dependent dehydrogenase (short-subunit alcohol dehydrogenase family)